MNKAWTYLSGLVLNGAEPEQDDAGSLDRMIREHPYFSGLHLMKALQSSSLERPEAGADRAKAALYFPDPHWLKLLLNDTAMLVPEGRVTEDAHASIPDPEPPSPAEVTTPDLPSEPAGAPQEEPVREAVESENVLAFEPLHTVDYFASQGIRFNPETGKDQLSLKMKSFTEWLKSMKRIHPERMGGMGEEDAVVKDIAETSNLASEVNTEAMAEVYLKQGLREKAIETYLKLSLLDPSKSAYFALRIKEIKEN